MGILSKKPIYTRASCDECGGPLELDMNFETAYCNDCGMQFTIHNLKKKKRQKVSSFDRVMDYVEAGRTLKRKDKLDKRERKEIEKKREDRNSIRILIGVSIFLIIIFVISLFM